MKTAVKAVLQNLASYVRMVHYPGLSAVQNDYAQRRNGLPYSEFREPRAFSSGASNQKYVSVLMERAGIKAAEVASVLDLASGVGNNLPTITTTFKNATVIAGDICQGALTHSTQKHARLSPRVGYVRIDAFRLPFPDNLFDCIFATELMEHISPERKSKLLLEIKRILKPGGHLIVTHPNYGGNLIGVIKRFADKQFGDQIWNPGHSHFREGGPEYPIEAVGSLDLLSEVGLNLRYCLGRNWVHGFLTPFIVDYSFDGKGIEKSLDKLVFRLTGYWLGTLLGLRTRMAYFGFVASKPASAG
ncbi:MAG: class I SAM-dependent methyltransferase [Candidatus Margulisiibacteriota bacterium]